MDSFYTALVNLGATGMLAAVLLYLQQQGRKDSQSMTMAFRSEIKAERDQCHDDHQKLFDSGNRILQEISNLRKDR